MLVTTTVLFGLAAVLSLLFYAYPRYQRQRRFKTNRQAYMRDVDAGVIPPENFRAATQTVMVILGAAMVFFIALGHIYISMSWRALDPGSKVFWYISMFLELFALAFMVCIFLLKKVGRSSWADNFYYDRSRMDTCHRVVVFSIATIPGGIAFLVVLALLLKHPDEAPASFPLLTICALANAAITWTSAFTYWRPETISSTVKDPYIPGMKNLEGPMIFTSAVLQAVTGVLYTVYICESPPPPRGRGAVWVNAPV